MPPIPPIPPILIFIDDDVEEARATVSVPVGIAIDIVEDMPAIEDMSMLADVESISWSWACSNDV